MHQNCRSIKSKIKQLKLQGVVETYKPDVLILSETWLGINEVDSLAIDGYKHVNFFIRHKRIHGGVSILTHNKLKVKKRCDIDRLSVEYHCELAAVEIFNDSNSQRIIVIGLYRTGKGDFKTLKETMSKLFDFISDFSNMNIVLTGDWNVDFLTDSSHKKALIDIMMACNFKNFVDFPTRIEDDSETSIDCVVSHMNNDSITIESIATGISDHDAQMITLQNNVSITLNTNYVTRTKRIINAQRIMEFGNALISYDWDHIFRDYDETTFQNFMTKFIWNMDIFFPKIETKRRLRRSTPWVSAESIKIQQDIHDLYTMQRQFPQFIKPDLILKKLQTRDELLLKNKIEYVDNRIKTSKNQKKEVWQVIKEDTNKCKTEWNWNLKERESSQLITNECVPDYLNNYFIAIGNELERHNKPNRNNAIEFLKQSVVELPDFEVPQIYPDELAKLAKKKIHNSETKDIFDVSGNLLYETLPFICNHLTFLVNNILSSTTYPEVLKISRVTPLYKGKGDTDDVQNYRPITIVPTISKLIECILSEAVMKHLNKNRALSDCQFAYRAGKSTTSATLSIVEKVTACLEKKLHVAAILLDLSKAFDSVDHKLLIDKLEVYGIRHDTKKLIKSFLTNRQQTVEVKIDGKAIRSAAQNIKIGVPQGSSFGNIMFIIFLNDLAHLNIKGDIIQYADDTTVVVSGESVEALKQNISETLHILNEWFQMNGLKLNTNKTSVICFNAVSPLLKTVPIYTRSQDHLESVNAAKLLGFELDSALTWKEHINATCKKMSKGIHALKQLRYITSEPQLREVYFSYVHSIMSYGILLWGCSTDYERVLKMQKRAIRVLTRSKPRETCRDHFKNLSIMTAVSVYIFEVLKYVRLILHEYEKQLKPKTRSCKNNNNFLLPIQHRLNMVGKLPKQMGQKLYNKLPECIQLMETEGKFQANVKKLLLSKSIYKISEFLNNDYRNYQLIETDL